MEKISPGRWRVNGTMRLDDFRREFPALGDVAEVETMGGLLTHLLGVVPDAGAIGVVSRSEIHRADRGRTARARTAGAAAQIKWTSNLLNWVGLGLCLLLSFLLSGMEAGVFALNRLRMRRLARAGKPSAKRLHRFLENPEKFLWTILVGNTLANFMILGFLLAKIHEWFLGNRVLIIAIFAGGRFFVLHVL